MKKENTVAKQKALQQKESTSEMGPKETNRAVQIARMREALCKITGIKDGQIAQRIMDQMASMQVWGRDSETPDRLIAAVAMIAELKPTNTTEALLAVQIFGVHEAALLFLQRAAAAGQTFEGSDANVHRAARLMRLFLEAGGWHWFLSPKMAKIPEDAQPRNVATFGEVGHLREPAGLQHE